MLYGKMTMNLPTFQSSTQNHLTSTTKSLNLETVSGKKWNLKPYALHAHEIHCGSARHLVEEGPSLCDTLGYLFPLPTALQGDLSLNPLPHSSLSTSKLPLDMSYSLNSLKGVMQGTTMWAIKA